MCEQRFLFWPELTFLLNEGILACPVVNEVLLLGSRNTDVIHSMDVKTYRREFAGKPLVVEGGKLAQQANGSVLVQYGETSVLGTVVMGKPITIPVRSLNSLGDRTTSGCTSFISRPA